MGIIELSNLASKKWANILLVVALFNITRLIAIFFQNKFLLTSPLIPVDIIGKLSAPHLFNAL